MRLFIALPLPADVASTASDLTPAHKAIRPVRPELLHLTLAFLGRIADERLDEVIAATRDAAESSAPFRAALDAAGTFPASGMPHVVWLGMSEGATESEALSGSVRRELAARGIPFDEKPFRPHVTLGRVREETDRVEARAVSAAVRALAFEALRYAVETVVVFESVLSPKGPRYTARATVALGSRR